MAQEACKCPAKLRVIDGNPLAWKIQYALRSRDARASDGVKPSLCHVVRSTESLWKFTMNGLGRTEDNSKTASI